ncbi:MAG: hypothetical protein PHC60_02165 [Heliobacteriaceae bacterium]|nr:hypothetical protein [Heliobacteriaceae bacterium]
MFRPEKGSVPLALVVLVILVTMAVALAGYAVREIGAAKHNREAIQARYAAEAGAEHFLYLLKEQLLQAHEAYAWPLIADLYPDGQLTPVDVPYLSLADLQTRLAADQLFLLDAEKGLTAYYQIADASIQMFDVDDPASPVTRRTINLPAGQDQFWLQFTVTTTRAGEKQLTRKLTVLIEIKVHVTNTPDGKGLIIAVDPVSEPALPEMQIHRWEFDAG